MERLNFNAALIAGAGGEGGWRDTVTREMKFG
jgi:hypothetical protein